MGVPFPLELRRLHGSSRAVARLSVLSVTHSADVVNAAFQTARYSQEKWVYARAPRR